MDLKVAKVLEHQKNRLWKALLIASDYDDVAIVDKIAKGIDLVGSHGPAPGLAEDVRPAEIDPKNLLDQSVIRREILQRRISEYQASEQQDLLQTSNEETRLRGLQSPFSKAQINELFQTDKWLLHPRFPIYQRESGKLRIMNWAVEGGG